MTDNLIAWLREQVDEDERRARSGAIKGHTSWRVEYGRLGDYEVVDGAGRVVVPELVNMLGTSAHIANFDPARVLAEVESKRRILDHWESLRAEVARYRSADEENPPSILLAGEQVLETTARAMALPYQDRPGFREEWRA